MIRVLEPRVTYQGRWTMKEHRHEMLLRRYIRALGPIWRRAMHPGTSPWLKYLSEQDSQPSPGDGFPLAE